MEQITFEDLSATNRADLAKVYKNVFQGSPWYEDRVCSGILLPEGNVERCTVQYTPKKIPQAYEGKLNETTRSGVVGESDFSQTTNCRVCQKPLIEFYPEFVNQTQLIAEAMQEEGFSGLLARCNEELVGFGWGYAMPQTPTPSVDFPRVIPTLRALGVEREKAFYWSEVGVVEAYQRRGIGRKITQSLLQERDQRTYDWLTLRTKNEAVTKILKDLFPGQEIKPRFNDPVRGTPWYVLSFSR